jgi:predicted O-linked N-acetylglucosamine transferase (SPINDLY family)
MTELLAALADKPGIDAARGRAAPDARGMRADSVFAEAALQAQAGDLSVSALIGVAEALRALGAPLLCQEIYHIWLAHNAAHPLAFAVRFNFAVVLSDHGALPAARENLLLALQARPDFAPAAINLGTLLERMDDRAGAVQAWQTLANQLAAVTGESARHRCTALNQMGRVLEAASIDAPAEAALCASLELDPRQRLVAQHFIALRQVQCRWPVLPPDGPAPPRDLLRAISPLSLAALRDDPVLQLANAHIYLRNDQVPDGAVTVGRWPPPARPAEARRLRIGYLSSDLREHAIGYLAAELFELHDPAQVESFAYYCGPAREDAIKARYRASAGCWRDISPLNDRDAAARIVADGIDILVDINGYTKDGRIKLFAHRPAPVIVNWLGFPGTTGSPHHDYIIADDFIIPPGDELFYSEQVLRLPCYQPNDRKRQVDGNTPPRAALGLPEDGFVFCAFNGPQKITSDVFAVWMEILRAVPGSVLWLLAPETATRDNLCAHARHAGIDPDRLVFAARMVNAAHVARFRAADLFLDTAPYGAHTTASDALWMGLPVLTCPGNSFAARVCGSLVRAAGLPDLLCANWQDYKTTAIALAQDRPRLAALAARLREGRDSCTLFDTPGLVRALERIYATIWRAHIEGKTPAPALAGLAGYHDIGCDPDRPALPDRETLLHWYRAELAYRDAVQPLPHDALLWRPEIAA